jgi:selenocysteine-specific elongation factor
LLAAVVAVRKVRFFKQAIASRTKFHVSVGHTTVLATAIFFTDPAEVVDSVR